MISDLQSEAVRLVRIGIRQSTRATYTSVQSQYKRFCEMYRLCAVPATQVTLLLYITSLNQKGIAHSSILVHLAGIRNLHVELGFGDINVGCPQIKQALKAIKDLV